MTASELVSTLTARGVTLSPRSGGRLSVRPLEMVKPDELDALREHKPEVLALLHPHPPEREGMAPLVCHGCKGRSFWESAAKPGHWACATCHPPAPGMALQNAPRSTKETGGGVEPTP